MRVTDTCSSEIFSMLYASQVSWLVENFNIRIYSDTINMTKVYSDTINMTNVKIKICMMVLLIELYLFVPLSVALTI